MGYPSYDLTFTTYDEWVARTVNHPTRTAEQQRAIFALGVGGEAGEVCDLVKKYEAHGRPIDRNEIGNEIGDVLWYLSALASTYGLTLEECARMNEAKLQKRYPDGFAPVRS